MCPILADVRHGADHSFPGNLFSNAWSVEDKVDTVRGTDKARVESLADIAVIRPSPVNVLAIPAHAKFGPRRPALF